MKKGFTLIELLIVIGILAILATVVVLVLNPAQLLAQSRDSRRISDLTSVKSAIGLYLATATSTTVNSGPTCTSSGCAALSAPWSSMTYTSSTLVNGTGWVLIDLTQASGGSALSALPIDPSNTTTYFYAYKGENINKTFELDTVLESNKYSGLMATDGGNSPSYYEIGTKLDL